MKKELSELYSGYLLCSSGRTTAAGLSELLNNQAGHDRITGFLPGPDFSSRDLRLPVKETVRSAEPDEGVLISDDTVEEKQRTDENEIITRHHDHSKNRTVRGVSIPNCLCNSRNTDIPEDYEIIHRPVLFHNPETGCIRRKSTVAKNELLRDMLKVCVQAAATELKPDTVQSVYLKGIDFPCLLCKQVFKNRDGSSGVLYPVSGDTDLTYDRMTAVCQKRRNIGVFHKSLKSDAALSESPAGTVRTRSSHFSASVYPFFKPEKLKIRHKLNHSALRTEIYLIALKAGFQKLQESAA